jgi:hypothetical protein
MRNERKVYEEPPHMRLPARFSVGNEAGERGFLDTRIDVRWYRELLLAEIVVNEVFFGDVRLVSLYFTMISALLVC